MNDVAFPIVLADGADVFVFDSLNAALQWLEPYDVQDGRYLVFDSVGQQLALEASTTSGRDAQTKLQVRVTAGAETFARQMAQTLRDYLRLRGRETPEKLVEIIAAVTQEARDPR